MKPLLTSLLFFASLFSFAQQTDSRYFELRIYYCHPGRLDALIERFQNHTTRIFEKHGMENIGYWLPTNNDKNALVLHPGISQQRSTRQILGWLLWPILNGKR